MKILYGAVPLAVAVLLGGCKGFWDPLPTTSTTTTTSTTLSSGYFYVLDSGRTEIGGYDVSSGTLQQLSGSPYSLTSFTTATPNCIAIAPGGKFLYVGTQAGIFVYAIQSNGSLNPISASNGGNLSADEPSAMQVDPSGSWLVDAYATGTSGNNGLQVNAIPLNSNGVRDTSRSVQMPNNLPSFTNAAVTTNSLAISPVVQSLSQYVFVAAGEAGTIAIPFTATNSSPLNTADIQSFSVLHSPGGAISVAVDPKDRLFYIGETNAITTTTANTGGLRVFDYSTFNDNTGTTPLSSGGTAPNAILPEASGGYVYVANALGTSTGNIAWFSVSASGSSYALTAGSNVGAGVNPKGLAEDSTSNFILVESSGGDPYLGAYVFDTTTAGQLDLSLKDNTYSAIAVTAAP
ncbi:MAG: hypothetical protein WBP85_07535 [Terracidiphilus sp.]